MSQLILEEQSAPSTPSTGRITIYADTADGKVKSKDDAGTVVEFGGGGTQVFPEVVDIDPMWGTAVEHNGSTRTFVTEGNFGVHGYRAHQGDLIDQAWEQPFFLKGGNYVFSVYHWAYDDAGIMKVYIDGVYQDEIDFYNGANITGVLSTILVTVVGDGMHTLKSVCESKNASSSAYAIRLEAMHIQ